MSRPSAIAMLVDARHALTAELRDKPEREATRNQRMLQDLERLLLNVRVGRTREFDLDFPNAIHVIVSD